MPDIADAIRYEVAPGIFLPDIEVSGVVTRRGIEDVSVDSWGDEGAATKLIPEDCPLYAQALAALQAVYDADPYHYDDQLAADEVAGWADYQNDIAREVA